MPKNFGGHFMLFIEAYKKAFRVISSKPIMLFGLSVLSGLICKIATFLTFFFAPLGIAFNSVVQCGMSKVYLDGLDGKNVNSDQLFSGFSRFFRVAGGMAWKLLWSIIWTLAAVLAPLVVVSVPLIAGSLIGSGGLMVASLVIAVILGIAALIAVMSKKYAYAFVPYILINQPEVNATEALRLSKKLTEGKKLQLFLADLVYYAGCSLVCIILSLLGSLLIGSIGFIFILLLVIALIIIVALGPLFKGLYTAEIYRAKPAVNPYNTYNTNTYNQ